MNTEMKTFLSSLLPFIGPFIIGIGTGSLFIWALWFSVQRGLVSKHPSLWFLGGLLLRVGITLSAFYLTANGDWRRLLVCLFGFVLARQLLTKRFAAPVAKKEGLNHAP
jgi:F1F0 ATPase subunit 2